MPGGTLWTVAQRRETEADLGSLAELKRPSLDFREPEAAGIGGLEQMREENYTTPPQKKPLEILIGLFNLLVNIKVCIYMVKLHVTRQRTTRDLYTEQFPELIPGWKTFDF